MESQQNGELSGVRVLLVEDNPVNQIVAQENLLALGCNVDLADDGLMALDRWQSNTYDIIYMDCAMPNMDGLQATREIRRREREQGPERHTTIVALTAHFQKENRDECFEAGMDDFMTKPFTRDELKQMLTRWTS
ncbi:response regulator [Futiania mangrovi]|uniref:Response regulator n=1 Tax=Futiania mangrovi TaxID=2959716 RepID=A0A9J6PN72_9PROT|nr:response regulator [Futiania mangrovii]MCP1337514.1 response regulator [Futiania mangrovii]